MCSEYGALSDLASLVPVLHLIQKAGGEKKETRQMADLEGEKSALSIQGCNKETRFERDAIARQQPPIVLIYCTNHCSS